MKIVDVRTMVVENDPPFIGGKHLVFVEIVTDEGIVGLGERVTGSGYSGNVIDLRSIISLMEEFGRYVLIGENPFNIELLWQRMYGERHDFRHPSLYATPVISALEMALWDIVGKAAGQPIYNLLGGKFHEKLRAYAYMPQPEGGFMANPEAAGPIAEKLLAGGQHGVQDRSVHSVVPGAAGCRAAGDHSGGEDLEVDTGCGGE